MATKRKVLGMVGRNVRRLRETRGLSVREAAERGGVSESTWRRVEEGASDFGVRTLARLSVGLRVEAEDLLEEPRGKRSGR